MQSELRVAEGRRQTGNDLCDQPVQIGVGWALNVQVPSANVVESFVVIHDGHIRVFKQGMHTQDLFANGTSIENVYHLFPTCVGEATLKIKTK